MRTIVIGDLHGCFTEFLELLEKVKYTYKDRLILTGDLEDRGPYSLECIRFAIKNNIEVTYGNHEDWYVRYRKNLLKKATDPSYQIRMRQPKHKVELYHKLTDAELDWIESLPTYIHIDNAYTVVHGGLLPDIPIDEQERSKVNRIRFIDRNNEMLPLNEDYSDPEDGIFWADKWMGPRIIIYGHNVSSLTAPRTTAYTRGIDTGGCFGGYLTALILEDGKESYEQVKCKEYLRSYLNGGIITD